MKIIAASKTLYPRSYARDNGDEALMISIQAAGSGENAASSATLIECSAHWTIAVCRSPDDSNTGVSLPLTFNDFYFNQFVGAPVIPLGFMVDVFVIGSRPVVVFPGSNGAFLNGATSKTLSGGGRFMMVHGDASNAAWAYFD